MPSGHSSRSEMEIELSKLSSPRIFLVRMLVFLVLCALVMVVLYKQIMMAFFANPGLNALIGARAPDRHHPVVPAGDPALPRGRLGQQFPHRRSRSGDRSPSETAGADGGDPRRRALGADDDFPADHAASAGLDCDAARRGARHLPLHDRPAGVSRPARHLLGPDRNRRFRRQGDRRAEGRRRCRFPVRHPEGGTGRAARRHGHFVLVVAVRPCRLADPGLPRPAVEPGAEPLLHRPRRLARLHGARIWRRRPARR